MKTKATALLRNESGMGILQMLVLAGISAAVLAGIGTAIVTMFKSQNTVAQSLDARLFSDQVSQLLSNDAMCGSFLSTSVLPVPAKTEIPVSGTLKLASGDKNIATGASIDENLEVKTASVRYEDTGSGVVTVVQGPAKTQYRIAQAVLKIQLQKKSTNTFVKDLQPLEIRMFANLGPGNNILGCSAFSAGSLACVAGGGIWNPMSPDGMKCIPHKYCQYAGSFSDAPLDQGGFKNPLTNGFNCPAGFDQQISGLINKASAVGKYSVANTPYRMYTCMSCGTPLSAQTAAPLPTGPLPMSNVNDEAYEAVYEASDSTAGLAEADTALAYKNWQDGLAKSKQYQANINQANATLANAQSAINDANSNASASYSASSSYSAAAAACAAATPPDTACEASNNAAANSAANDGNYWSNEASNRSNYLASITPGQNAIITQNTNDKKLQDIENPKLEQKYWEAKAVSDYYRLIAKCSFTKWKAKEDPSLPPDSCDAIPACPVKPASPTVITPYGSC